MYLRTEFLNDPDINYTNGATIAIARTIVRKIGKDISWREENILKNLETVEQNNEVPEGYIQYVFYDKKGNGFQAGKYSNGSYGVSL